MLYRVDFDWPTNYHHIVVFSGEPCSPAQAITTLPRDDYDLPYRLAAPAGPVSSTASPRGNRDNILFWPVFFVIFASIAASFGYQTLNRYDPRICFYDARSYYDMVEGNYGRTVPPFHHRLLTPLIASGVRKLIPVRLIRTWDPRLSRLAPRQRGVHVARVPGCGSPRRTDHRQPPRGSPCGIPVSYRLGNRQ